MLRGWLAAFALGSFSCAVAACSFDGGGIADDTGDPDAAIDAPGSGDQDDDGIADADDNCPATANSGQEDEDGDAVGNVCDNCPHVGNADQANDGEAAAGVDPDGAGDACDPYPAAPGNDILYFEGFDDAGVLGDWSIVGNGQWSVSGGDLVQASPTATTWIYLRTRQFTGIVLDADMDVTAFGAAGGGSGLLTSFSTAGGNGAGYYCFSWYNNSTPTGYLNLIKFRGASASQTIGGMELDERPTPGTYSIRSSVAAGSLECAVSSPQLSMPYSDGATDSDYPMGFIGLRTQTAAARFPYLVVFAVAE